jgi:hypothetical protein
VLELRERQLEVEEIKFKQHLATVADLDRARAELEAAGNRAEVEVRKWSPVAGADLAALGSFRIGVRIKEQQLGVRRESARKALETQQAAMLEARRRWRLLERLKERRRVEWQAASDRELEELASESYLAGWTRRES